MLPIGEANQSAVPLLLSIAIALCVGAVGAFFIIHTCIRKHSACDDVPSATGSKFLIGHALAYKKDPAAFLLRQSQLVGSVFRINLAGRRMIVLCGGSEDTVIGLLKKAMNASERILSSRDPVADIGFEYTLGKANVYDGTDFHKRLIKDYLNQGERTIPRLASALREAYDVEVANEKLGLDGMIIVKDFLGFVRRSTIRTVVGVFLGSAFLRPHKKKEDEGTFLAEFMILQDEIEEATAAAAVLPRWLSLPLVLRPVERSRLKLQKSIAKRILDAWCAPIDEQGPWLIEFREKGMTVELASEYIVGLLFAAHKNPAIGSAQAYLYLRLQGSEKDQAEVKSEANTFLESPTSETLEQRCQHIRRCCLETLRLTSHALGAIRTVREEVTLGECPMAPSASRCGDKTRIVCTLYPGEVIAISHIVPSLSKSL